MAAAIGINELVLLSLLCVYTQVTRAVSTDNPNCSSPPSPIALRVGDVTLNSRPSTSDEDAVDYIRGYGTDIVIGAQQMAPFINIAQPDCFVNAGFKNCSVIRNPSQSCPIDSRTGGGFQYPKGSEVLSGGLLDLDLSPYPTNLPDPGSQSSSNIGLFARLPIMVGNNELNSTVRHSQAIAGWKIIPSYLGLGKGSELLNQTFNAGLLPSRSWSFYSGAIDPYETNNTAKDGSFIMGGYDASRLAGDFVKFDISSERNAACMFAAEVTSIKWLNRTITDKFTACISPSNNRLQFPRSVFSSLRGALNSPLTSQHRSYIVENIDLRNPIIPAEVPGFDLWNTDVDYLTDLFGTNTNMVITVNGIEITIPSRRLFHPKLSITDGQDTITIRNPYRSGTREASLDNIPNYMAIISYPEDGGDPIFGLPFLSAAYLMANYEDSTFSLAPLANTAQRPLPNISPILMPSCYPAPESKSNTRTIAIGVAVPLSIIAIVSSIWALVFCLRRRRKKTEVPLIPQIPDQYNGPEKMGTELAELGGTEQIHGSGGNQIFQADGNAVFQTDSNQVFQKDSNQVYQVTDDFGAHHPLVKHPDGSTNSVSSGGTHPHFQAAPHAGV